MKIFLYSSVYSCHLFLISSASVQSILFLSFIVPIFAWNVPLVSLIFLKRSLVFPILLFSSISLHWSLRKSFLFLLAILWSYAFKWVYLSFSPLPLASLLFITICKASSDNHFAFLHFFFLGMVLILVLPPIQCHEHLFMCLLAIWMFSLEKCLFSSLAHFLIRSLIFLELCCRGKFVTLYRRQWSRWSPRKRNAKRQNDCVKRPYK